MSSLPNDRMIRCILKRYASTEMGSAALGDHSLSEPVSKSQQRLQLRGCG
ncbi:hypothetical protein SNOG_09953 [Parastagonospora nodorum SN15]|uniref:Uncharacterized protein n=1 Tax=Phaeosphaeria nodorum (strain SN15 / ATCC MYA-4574 / FGSC 10173) TaxID=321614 RepID=Q0UE61_PHANO|nr:hypothetical protein SNOG_09953 [Parastagonospora nodorum SN15]EAT82288.1 hypothetical protein SNOG_09953 [Parastagonospora nodorum SN15]